MRFTRKLFQTPVLSSVYKPKYNCWFNKYFGEQVIREEVAMRSQKPRCYTLPPSENYAKPSNPLFAIMDKALKIKPALIQEIEKARKEKKGKPLTPKRKK